MAAQGAEAAAARAAEVALPLLGGPGGQVFEAQRGTAPEPRMGDLTCWPAWSMRRTAGAARGACRSRARAAGPRRWVAGRRPAGRVLLLGDSNGLRSDFAERLGRRLGREVWNQSQDGGYFAGAML
ncbi:alginate O-acetyltransferase AlgX-related protein, partial [Paracidovorax cattleyae]|uniref:alginate O-acetyltransferase AlgX-related protein n=1 Tax=Paracidovorax cattleyae TaxID=80868 RepID=UPI003EBDD89E